MGKYFRKCSGNIKQEIYRWLAFHDDSITVMNALSLSRIMVETENALDSGIVRAHSIRPQID